MATESLEFDCREGITAFDLVSALAGVTAALDYGCVSVSEDFDRGRDAGLATAARLLAHELQGRLSEAPVRRRQKPRLVEVGGVQ